MGRFINNIHFVKMFVPDMAKIPAPDSNYITITYCGVPTETEERDNRSKDIGELFL